MARPVVDLFSCGGGMSAGFAGAFRYEIRAAVDLEVAKPSGKGAGETGCNRVYAANHGVLPLAEDLGAFDPQELMRHAGLKIGETGVLISCAPCTDFSRANPANHVEDKARNSLVGRSGVFAAAMRPAAFAMENARELLMGRHPSHWAGLRASLEESGMAVSSGIHMLTKYGLPQLRERALVLAVRRGRVRTLEDLWDGWSLPQGATTVRHALGRLDEWLGTNADGADEAVHPGTGPEVRARIEATPANGGGWAHLGRAGRFDLMTPECVKRFRDGALGSHPDVYGRMWWDRPAPTLKRECAHTGNGRYLHPERHRLMTVREAAVLQGFPFGYRFPATSVANRYRIIGDAVPPLVARQIAACLHWSTTGLRPDPAEWVLPECTLRVEDLVRTSGRPVAGFALEAA